MSAPTATAPVLVRPANAADEPLLREIYADARAEEVAAFGWPAARTEAFLAGQFDAQRGHYRTAWPHAVDGIVEAGGAPVGRLYADRGPDALTVLDIALLAAHRGNGIGGVLLRGLQAEAAALDVPIDLRVLRSGRALRLYERLGFRCAGDDGLRLALRWCPPGHAEWTAAVGTPGRLAGVPALPADCSDALRCGGFEQFSVALLVSADAPVDQGTHRFEHPALGALDVFVVPSARTAEGLTLTASFARRRQSGRPAA